MTSHTDAAFACLLAARREDRRVPADFMTAHPLSPHEGLAVQARIQASLGAVGGWKASASSTSGTPNFAVVPAAAIHEMNIALPAELFRSMAVECEIAYRIGRDLIAPPYTRDEIGEAISSVMALVELCCSRLDDYAAATPGWRLADGGRNHAFVTGSPCEDWRSIDLQRQRVTLRFGDKVMVERMGHPRPDPVAIVQLLANQAGGFCGGVRAGQVIATGSMTGTLALDSEADVLASFGGLGEIRVTQTVGSGFDRGE